LTFDRDMKFISDFMNAPFPQENFWMTKYFRGRTSAEFVRYFSIFRSSSHFSEHTGLPCSKRWLKRIKSRFLKLESVRDKARRDLDFELLSEIEMGRFKLY
jgi:hypothetical protein